VGISQEHNWTDLRAIGAADIQSAGGIRKSSLAKMRQGTHRNQSALKPWPVGTKASVISAPCQPWESGLWMGTARGTSTATGLCTKTGTARGTATGTWSTTSTGTARGTGTTSGYLTTNGIAEWKVRTL
jgi:hypothetical protein